MFRTALQPPSYDFEIGLQSPILSLGSCFAQSMGNRLLAHKFKALVNPFGTLFNPISIFKLLQMSLDKDLPNDFEEHFVQNQGIWHHYDFHSEFSASTKADLAQNIAKALQKLRHFIHTQKPQVLLLTFGTAWVYELKTSQKVVANCHKTPAQHFEKRLLSLEEITQAFQLLQQPLKNSLPHLQILLTVSPVRHIKDTLPLNTVSKSLLRVLCHQWAENYAQVSYFPSYEMMLDDLRDYRFYEADMLHPNEVAQAYIWEQFQQSFFSENTRQVLKKWAKVQKALQHKAFHPQSPAHRAFLEKTKQQLQNLSAILDLQEELKMVEGALGKFE